MYDCLIIGAGVIGLSTAYELAAHGLRVCVVDRQQPGREASWAGAGILLPAKFRPGDPPAEQLAALSVEFHPQWAAELRETTGVDTGYRRCGALYVARSEQTAEELATRLAPWQTRGIRVKSVPTDHLEEFEPHLTRDVASVWLLPEQAQIRNPRHLKALLTGCHARGVEVRAGVAVEDFQIRDDRITALETNQGRMTADHVCLAAGSWSGTLARKLGLSARIKPIRGQIVLLETTNAPLRHVIEIDGDSRYFVPRPDGRLLVGSTEEDVGFDNCTTARGVAGLLQLALEMAPHLAAARVERTWAGLRPGSADGLPYLGQIPHVANGWIAAGHFRRGLALAPATAVVMSRLIRGVEPEVDLRPFRPDRDANSQ